MNFRMKLENVHQIAETLPTNGERQPVPLALKKIAKKRLTNFRRCFKEKLRGGPFFQLKETVLRKQEKTSPF